MYNDEARKWSKYVDSRYIEQRSFKVVLQSILESQTSVEAEEEEEDEYEDFMVDWTVYAQSEPAPTYTSTPQRKRRENVGSGDSHCNK
jgi:hypothetical protein